MVAMSAVFNLLTLIVRSGTTYYKPDVRHACCPHYTIRLVLGRV